MKGDRWNGGSRRRRKEKIGNRERKRNVGPVKVDYIRTRQHSGDKSSDTLRTPRNHRTADPGRPPARWRRTFDPNYSSIELLTLRTPSSNPGAEIFSGRHQSKHPEIDEERALFGGQRRGFQVVFTSPIEWETQEK